jgi:hypothetical protein
MKKLFILNGLWCSLPLAAGGIPSSVLNTPHGRLEEMERETDLIFKGCVISTEAPTNALFPYWGRTHATRFSLISVLKGRVATNEPVFWHITHGPDGWGGGSMPSWHEFEPGQCYVIFAARLDKPEDLYTVPADATNRPNEFRQLYRDGVMRTVDSRAVSLPGVKDVIWLELNLLLNDAKPTNQLYAVGLLDRMSLGGGADDHMWTRGDDFRREAVLEAVQPLIKSRNEIVSASAIGCFHVCGSCVTLIPDYSGWMPISRGCPQGDSKSIARVAPYADDLVAAANSSSSSLCRVAAIAALSCTRFSAVSNSLPRWLADPAAQVRAQAVLLLPDFPGDFCERSLREMAADASPVVRAAVADAIGNGKIEALLPALGALFSTSLVRTNSGPWPHKGLQGDDYFAEVGADDIHTSAGYALLKFDVEQVGAILKANLSDLSFGLSFIRRLAQNGAEPYLPLLAKELKAHTAGSEQEAVKNGFHWSLSYWLEGSYGWAWETLFGCVSAQTREALADPKMGSMLDALQIADDPGDARTRSLYGFFLDKGMIERAIELRRGIIRRTEDKAIDKKSFNFPSLLKAFDEMDEKHSLKPGLGL